MFSNITYYLKKRWKLILVLIVLGVGLWWFFSERQGTPEKEYRTQHPEVKTLKKTLDLSGRVNAKERARLRFIAGGKLVYLGAQEGESVKKWQTIATIDGATLKKQLEQDLNTYMKERWDWEQTLDDTKDRVLPESENRDKDKSQWDLENEVLDVEIRDIAIRNTALTAPFDGVLTVSPTQVTGVQLLSTDYFEIINPDTLIFSAQVEEEDIGSIFAGQQAIITFDAYPEMEIESNVSYVSFTASDTSNGTVFTVEFPLLSSDLSTYRIGMNGDAQLLLNQKANALTIPVLALIEHDGKTFVEVENNEKMLDEKEVILGLETDEEVEVISGLSPTDLVAIPE